jgi:S-adenosylmethionine/arginine decarboxylase-like enzyme
MSEVLPMPETKNLDAPWGYQLIVDCFGCDFEVCCDLEKGYEFLDKICIQIHTSAHNRFISIDVYSCKKFEQSAVEEFVKGWFGPAYIESVLLYRGQGVYQRRLGQSLVAAGGTVGPADGLSRMVGQQLP